MASLYKQQQIDYLKSRVYEVDQVLDVGGGDKRADEYTTVKANRYLVMDNDPAASPDFLWNLNDFGHPEEVFAIERDPHFDLIFCLNVFEYINQSYNAMANLYTWLRPGGKLVVTLPFIYPLHNPVGIDYTRYTHEWARWVFYQKFKFRQVDIKVLEATAGAELLRQFYLAEKMHMRKGDNSWREIGCIVEAVK